MPHGFFFRGIHVLMLFCILALKEESISTLKKWPTFKWDYKSNLQCIQVLHLLLNLWHLFLTPSKQLSYNKSSIMSPTQWKNNLWVILLSSRRAKRQVLILRYFYFVALVFGSHYTHTHHIHTNILGTYWSWAWVSLKRLIWQLVLGYHRYCMLLIVS